MHEMQTGLRQEKIRQTVVFLAVAGVVVLIDQISKALVLEHLTRFADHGMMHAVASRVVPVIPSILRFRFAQNSGAAFSILRDHPEFLVVIAAVMSVVVMVWALAFLGKGERLGRVSLALVFGGAVGNLVDRVRYDLYVVDFIEIHWRGRPLWPTFNIADSAICVGIGLFFVASLLAARQEKKAATP